jgi:hypothetical protein
MFSVTAVAVTEYPNEPPGRFTAMLDFGEIYLAANTNSDANQEEIICQKIVVWCMSVTAK